jgi:CRISPR-associated endonuclease/helicase Cas3
VDYESFFRAAVNTGGARPYPFQRRLAESDEWPLIVDVPTGLGKTEAIVLAWLYRRHRSPEATPRRLVYVLPQRSLVEQTVNRTIRLIANLSASGIDLGVDIETMMGGEVERDWLAQPEVPTILVGTQDMVLSRALNRGYAMSRFKWPMAFAWLHSDAWWVIDEVQLQGVGVTTAAQMQGLRSKIGVFGLTRTTFVSATLDPTWIDTIDHPLTSQAFSVKLDADDLREPAVSKRLDARKIATRLDVYEPKALAGAVAGLHQPGTRSLVVVNTVDRAIQTARSIGTLAPQLEVVLLHSRFRPGDRERLLGSALDSIDPNGAGRIVVATQVVEAGVDFSARLLISDIAPWSSIVQRLGRCNRAGDDVDAIFGWVEPPELKAGTVLPYSIDDVREAREVLLGLEGADLAPRSLPHVPMRRESGAVLRRVDLLELFDTAPDLSGVDVDVSRFIRDADDFTVRVLWRTSPPTETNEVRREELCPATRPEVDKLLKRLAESDRRSSARVSRPTSDEPWTAFATAGQLRIGDVIWIACEAGGYDVVTGFDPNSRDYVHPVETSAAPGAASHESQTIASDARAFVGEAMTIETHADDAVEAARKLTTSLLASGLIDTRLQEIVVTSARWHDAGKVHYVFQNTLKKAGVGDGDGPWAKSSASHSARHERIGFRHEAVSALAWLAENDGQEDADLIAYLIMAHHGKVRLGVQRLTIEPSIVGKRMLCGILDGEDIPSAPLGNGVSSPAFVANLDIFDVGMRAERPTWGDRIGDLCDDPSIGIFRLAYLESLVRIADWRASAVRHSPALAIL